ncbi:hypothetical protein KKA95_04930 [Patescibacteria group bacterium]|nr:hypothetical protein [Patescibacteria group bacterium]
MKEGEPIYCQVDVDDRETVSRLIEEARGNIAKFLLLFENRFGYEAPVLDEKVAAKWVSLGHANKLVRVNPEVTE